MKSSDNISAITFKDRKELNTISNLIGLNNVFGIDIVPFEGQSRYIYENRSNGIEYALIESLIKASHLPKLSHHKNQILEIAHALTIQEAELNTSRTQNVPNLLIPDQSGWPGHRVGIAIIGDNLIYTNCGSQSGSNPGSFIFPISKDQRDFINTSFSFYKNISHLFSSNSCSEEFFKKIEDFIGTENIHHIQNSSAPIIDTTKIKPNFIKEKQQKRGDCVKTNLKKLIKPILLLQYQNNSELSQQEALASAEKTYQIINHQIRLVGFNKLLEAIKNIESNSAKYKRTVATMVAILLRRIKLSKKSSNAIDIDKLKATLALVKDEAFINEVNRISNTIRYSRKCREREFEPKKNLGEIDIYYNLMSKNTRRTIFDRLSNTNPEFLLNSTVLDKMHSSLIHLLKQRKYNEKYCIGFLNSYAKKDKKIFAHLLQKQNLLRTAIEYDRVGFIERLLILSEKMHMPLDMTLMEAETLAQQRSISTACMESNKKTATLTALIRLYNTSPDSKDVFFDEILKNNDTFILDKYLERFKPSPNELNQLLRRCVDARQVDFANILLNAGASPKAISYNVFLFCHEHLLYKKNRLASHDAAPVHIKKTGNIHI